MIAVNPMLGEAAVAIGGETLVLVLDVTAFLALERMTGRSFLEVAAELLTAAEAKRAPMLETMQALVFAGTRARHPALTAADCAALYIRHAAALIDAVSEALAAALPEGESEPGEAPPPTTTCPAGAGNASSAAGSKRAGRSKASGAPPRG